MPFAQMPKNHLALPQVSRLETLAAQLNASKKGGETADNHPPVP